jgi:hypothetical protein
MRSKNIIKIPLIRKAFSAYQQVLRVKKRIQSNEYDFAEYPPVLANSFPKSGTHLLLQILRVLPDVAHYGSFIASMPTLTFKERTHTAHMNLIDQLVPGEVCPAHLFFYEAYADALQRKQGIHFFIYRDPRDVVVSEAHYITHMNRWHRMHRYYKALKDDRDQFSAAIVGFSKTECPYDYPNVADRFSRYAGWLDRPDVLPVRYEQLRGSAKIETLNEIVSFYSAGRKKEYDHERIVNQMLANINPRESHTFRSGKIGGWRSVFTEKHKEQMKIVAGDLLIKLGYERDLAW